MRFTLKLFEKQRQYSKSFADKLRIYVRAGHSGKGNPSTNGHGGEGGNVYVAASNQSNFTLLDLRQLYPEKRFIAPNGKDSSSWIHNPSPAKNIYVPAPLGVLVKDDETNQVIGTIDKPGDKVLVAKGAKGGNRYTSYKLRKVTGKSVVLDLQIIADVGFVGLPNAGKSTLLNAISNARPEVADYPFTTLRPYVGVVKYNDHRSLRCADLPGLIEGAYRNEGMGHNFLKHIERTKVMLMIVDIFGFTMTPSEKHVVTACETVQLLIRELELYNKAFLTRPTVLALNKVDVIGAEEKFNETMNELTNWQKSQKTKLKFYGIVPISAKQGSGLDELKDVIRSVVDDTVFSQDGLNKLSSGQTKKLNTG